MKEISKSTFGVSISRDGDSCSVYGESDDFHGFAAGFLAEDVSEDEARSIAADEESRRDDVAAEVLATSAIYD